MRHPKVMEKLRAEIASTCAANSDLSRDDIRRMQYLQNVLKESMFPKFAVNQLCVLTTVPSFATLSICSGQYSYNNEDHGTPHRWWSRSQVSSSYPERKRCCLFGLLYAQAT
jgi:hypothetical protein